ncbi:trimeric intracellular cation channel family protein [Lysobacter sp. HDW10]|uniref:trimeric intracellular cation channel family protein n=1 Tax=Lysobacter sp. HDW10 TaxID=2714936 RepID=UPI001F0F19D7|nr:trimeric intracellular cation channel family protein [Lysobacter sp. HDW10]
MPSSDMLLLIADLIGTFVFALSGATVATRRQLDLFGVLVLSFAASSAGGICRDVLIGATPPAALRDWRYLAVAMAAGLITFLWAPLIERMKTPVRMFDAAGLGLFAVAGAQKALDYGLNPVMAALLGMLTGIGGGMLRDVLLADVPMVLRADLYAIAALAGATVVVVGIAMGLPSAAVMFAGALFCFVLRMLAVRRGWHLPVAGNGHKKSDGGPS